MTGLLFCLSAAAMGVDYGWQPVAGGGIEYIIQIDPALVDSLKEGSDLFSDLPSSVSNVRRYRITVGNARLPHHGEPPPAVVPAGGGSAGGSEGTSGGGPDEVDMSQLPGPVLAPALAIDAPTNASHGHDNEPERLADSEAAAPLGTRMSGFRQQREPPPAKEPTDAPDDEAESPLPSSESKARTPPPEERVAAREPESPSDRSSNKSDNSLTTRTALTQVGLFTSVCLNVFLIWVTAGQRSRYRSMVRRIFEGSGAALTSRDADLPRWERLPAPAEEGVGGDSGKQADNVGREA